jgi:hypothetical protein
LELRGDAVIVLIPIEHVLTESVDLKSAFPNKWAKPLYEALMTEYRVILQTGSDQELARWWLNRNGFFNYATVRSWDGLRPYEDWLVDEIREHLSDNWEIAFFLTNNPDVATRVRGLGVMSLVVGTPSHRPGWKADDEGYVPWESLEERLA